MIAEDEADIRNLVMVLCQMWGHTPIAFESGQKAWDWLDSVESGQYNGALPQLALMDIRMPGYHGNDVARRIRQTQSIYHIPIVLMTAFVLPDSEKQAMFDNDGVDLIINKPLPDFEELRKILHGIIQQKSAG